MWSKQLINFERGIFIYRYLGTIFESTVGTCTKKVLQFFGESIERMFDSSKVIEEQLIS